MVSVSDTSSASTVKLFEKRVYDKAQMTPMEAPDIGALQNNRARLNAIGKLDEKDKEDLYRFNVHTAGQLTLGLDTDKLLRVQIMKLNGQRVIADSQEGMGAATEAFAAMSAGTYEMEPGSYLVKISFAKDEPPAPTDYAVQLKLGQTYPNDYVTWESQASTKPEIPQPVMNPVVGMFSSFIKSIFELFGNTR